MKSQLLPDARLSLDVADAKPATQLYRRLLELESPPQRAELRLFAESNYHLWVNGQYAGRGPIYHHPFVRPFDTYDVASELRAGRNVLAVLVHAPGIALHNNVPSGEPGLTARLELTNARGQTSMIDVDEQWKTSSKTGWSKDVPRRSWAIGHIESFDASQSQQGWQQPEFDDRGWANAQVQRPASALKETIYIARPVPALRYEFLPAKRPTSLFAITDPPRPISKSDNSSVFGKGLIEAEWDRTDSEFQISDGDPATGAFTICNLKRDRGAVICFDLGAQFTGQVIFECTCPSAGVIDVGWSETVENGKPWFIRKGVSYSDRVHAQAGRNAWHPIGYSGMRHLVLILRNFEGEVRFDRFGLLATEPDVTWPAQFECSDERLNSIWKLCARSQRIGTQEGMLDCPTREQAPYVGDGQLTGRWFSMLTGDTRHWEYLVNEQFRRQSRDGLLRSSVFSGSNDTLVDYTLLAVIGLRDYWRFTGDNAIARKWLDAARLALSWFEKRLDASGLCVLNDVKTQNRRTWEQRYDPSLPRFEGEDATHLFIDHPGMGWHNVGEAGIDRRGANCAINALLVQTWRAVAEMEENLGEIDRATAHRAEADRIANLVREKFFDVHRGAFVDGIFEGKQLEQVSEQTNTWCIVARCCDDQTARSALETLLTSDDKSIARNGPYFWAYLLPELARLGLHDLAVKKMRDLWGRMIDHGATTLWETFKGDDLDSWCHPWSAAPVEFLPVHIAGLPGHCFDSKHLTIRPRYDLLENCSAKLMTRAGLVSIAWRREGQRTTLQGELPQSWSADLLSVNGNTLARVSGIWTASADL